MQALAKASESILLIVAALFLAGELGGTIWQLDLLSHLRPYYIFLFVALGLPQFFSDHKSSFYAVIMIGFGLFSLFTVYKSFFVKYIPADSKKALQTNIRVIGYNVLSENSKYQPSLDYLKQSTTEGRKHIFVITEVTDAWAKQLEQLNSTMPTRQVEIRDDNFGIALYSDLPAKKIEILSLDDNLLPAVVATLDLNGKDLIAIGVHPAPPTRKVGFEQRNIYFQNVRKIIDANPGTPIIVVGDFNSTPWSDHFRRLLQPKGANLRLLLDANQGPWHGFTWYSPLPLVGLPIDFILHTEDLRPEKFKIGPPLGSDHRPLLADFY